MPDSEIDLDERRVSDARLERQRTFGRKRQKRIQMLAALVFALSALLIGLWVAFHR